MIFSFMHVGKNKTGKFFQRLKIALPCGLVQFWASLKKFTHDYLFQIALEIMRLAIQIRDSVIICNLPHDSQEIPSYMSYIWTTLLKSKKVQTNATSGMLFIVWTQRLNTRNTLFRSLMH